MKDYMYLMFKWLMRIMHWLARAWLAVFAAAVVVAAIWLSFLLHTEPAIRLAGLFFQLLGLSAAAIGIRDTRRMFGKPSFLQSVRNWASSWPRFRPKPQHINLSGLASIGSSASATVWHGTADGEPLEKRVDAIEANLREIETRVRTAEGSISSNERAFKSMLRQESEERTAHDQVLHRKIEATSTDGLRLAAAGAFWLAAGVVLSTASPELIAWCT